MDKTGEELVERAYALREETHRLLYEEGLLGLLESYGPARVTGSFVLDLMARRDVDLEVRLPDGKDIGTFFEIGNRIATNFRVLKMSYSNWFLRDDLPVHPGLYWGIRLLHCDRTWKVDLWGFGKEDYEAYLNAFEELKRSLAGADRMAILRIKDAMGEEENYTSLQIYEAVRRDDIKTAEEFRKWLRR